MGDHDDNGGVSAPPSRAPIRTCGVRVVPASARTESRRTSFLPAGRGSRACLNCADAPHRKAVLLRHLAGPRPALSPLFTAEANRAPEVHSGRTQSLKIHAHRTMSTAPSLPSSSMAIGSAASNIGSSPGRLASAKAGSLARSPPPLGAIIDLIPSPAKAVRSSCARRRRRVPCSAPQCYRGSICSSSTTGAPRSAYRRAASPSPQNRR